MRRLDLDTETLATLRRYGFDAVPFEALTEQLMAGGLDPARNRLPGPIFLPEPGSLPAVDAMSADERARLHALGQAAIDAGQVAVVILNGGMATRFGGVPKGATEALDGRSFLDFKLSQIARAGAGRVTALLMNSFATEAPTAVHLEALGIDTPIRCFNQLISVRLTPGGEIFLGADGRPSLHAPGHGDLPDALVRSGELARLQGEGVRWITMSNVDNLGASLDPLIVGAHIDAGRPMTSEQVRTLPGDVGGFPAWVDGRLTVVEALRAPVGFDPASSPVFNANNFVFDLDALAGPLPLTWYAVLKKVDGRTAVQFERLVGQLTDLIDASFLIVPREGARCRFLGIKAPEDLAANEGLIREVLRGQGVL